MYTKYQQTTPFIDLIIFHIIRFQQPHRAYNTVICCAFTLRTTTPSKHTHTHNFLEITLSFHTRQVNIIDCGISHLSDWFVVVYSIVYLYRIYIYDIRRCDSVWFRLPYLYIYILTDGSTYRLNSNMFRTSFTQKNRVETRIDTTSERALFILRITI